MKWLRCLKDRPWFEGPVAVTLGNFDGMHRGHQSLLARLSERARGMGGKTWVIFFEPQPSEFLSSSNAPVRLMSRRHKFYMLQKLGVDYVSCLNFNTDLATSSALTFAKEILFRDAFVRYLLIGSDFRFGAQREGTPLWLESYGKKLGCCVEIHDDFLENNQRVSSTSIRQALAALDLEKAACLLGRPYSVYGRVVYGDARARLWGFPTANVRIETMTLPLRGVFLVRVDLKRGQQYWGVANLGYRPTFEGTRPVLEVHLFDFNEMIYHQSIEVSMIAPLREEKKFESVPALIEQIQADIAHAKALLNEKFTLNEY